MDLSRDCNGLASTSAAIALKTARQFMRRARTEKGGSVMARNISTRIDRMRSRRQGTDRLAHIAQDAQRETLAKSLTEEAWLKRAANKPHTRYALGAMQEVEPEYTRISIETAERVGSQLKSSLPLYGIPSETRLQGSVPLNVHIRGVSDVDLLCLRTDFLTYAAAGIGSRRGRYVGTTRTSLTSLVEMRTHAESILKVKFPAAKVDVSGGKAIKISGGSLARPVDVVPSHWNDTLNYQISQQESDRGVTILDKKKYETIDNTPFLHIRRVIEACNITTGGLRKSIRLCKNVKADAEAEGTSIPLPSYEIAATMYHADRSALKTGGLFYELAILAETQRHLDALVQNKEYAKTLRTPDGSRYIFDTEAKLTGLLLLSVEIDELAKEVAKEQNALLALRSSVTLSESRDAIAKIYVPG